MRDPPPRILRAKKPRREPLVSRFMRGLFRSFVLLLQSPASATDPNYGDNVEFAGEEGGAGGRRADKPVTKGRKARRLDLRLPCRRRERWKILQTLLLRACEVSAGKNTMTALTIILQNPRVHLSTWSGLPFIPIRR